MVAPEPARHRNAPRSVQSGAPRFHVEEACIHCTICARIAPACFASSPQADRCVVVAQPTDEDSEARCREAVDNCPVEAIGITPSVR